MVAHTVSWVIRNVLSDEFLVIYIQVAPSLRCVLQVMVYTKTFLILGIVLEKTNKMK